MERVSVDDVEPTTVGGVDRRELSDPLGTADVAINRYRLDPGDGLPGGLHAHADQEEVFVVLEGELTFETLSGEIDVAAGEAIRFAPGEFQSGANAADDDAVVYALGAPRESEDVRVPLPCSECGHESVRPAVADGEAVLSCPECGAESAAACENCGGDGMRVVLGEDETPVAACPDCGYESETA